MSKEIIHCVDCIHFMGYGGNSTAHDCELNVFYNPSPYDFCSCAKKKKVPKTIEGCIEEIESHITHWTAEQRSCHDHASDCMNEAKNRGLEEAVNIIREYFKDED